MRHTGPGQETGNGTMGQSAVTLTPDGRGVGRLPGLAQGAARRGQTCSSPGRRRLASRGGEDGRPLSAQSSSGEAIASVTVISGGVPSAPMDPTNSIILESPKNFSNPSAVAHSSTATM